LLKECEIAVMTSKRRPHTRSVIDCSSSEDTETESERIEEYEKGHQSTREDREDIGIELTEERECLKDSYFPFHQKIEKMIIIQELIKKNPLREDMRDRNNYHPSDLKVK